MPGSTSRVATFAPPREEWLAQGREESLDPRRLIVDAHHHLWLRDGHRYLAEEFSADVATVPNVAATVYVECGAMFRPTGANHLKPVGEVEFAAEIAKRAAVVEGATRLCAAIVGYADLCDDAVGESLDALVQAGSGRFRGIRHVAANDPDPAIPSALRSPPSGLLADPAFRRGFAQLAERGLTFDAYVWHPQLAEVADLADAFPHAAIVLNHAGTPLGVGSYAGRSAEVRASWEAGIRTLAQRPNVRCKLGGLGMSLTGFAFDRRPAPPSSAELAEAWAPFLRTAIELFGPDRCMFESNFPPDKGAAAYTTIWNAFKRIAAAYTEPEIDRLMHGTAEEFYCI